MKGVFLGLDTSNYTTSAALYGDVNYNGKKLLPVAPGKIGLRQSDAVFHHTKQLPDVFELAMKELKHQNITAIGVSDKPRAVADSYMPCFLVGEGLGRNLSSLLDVPIYRFSHQQGHIAAALYSCERLDLLEEKIIALHISGGTTEVLLVTPDENGLPRCGLIASSTDLKAGQAIDRVGVMLDLPFPAGKYMDELANKSQKKYKIKPSIKDKNISLSGVQNKCEQMLKNGENPEDISNFCLEYIITNIGACLDKVIEEYGDLPIVFSGGVSSNTIMKKRFTKKYGALFAKPEYSADNAFGVAVLASIVNKRMG